MFNQVLPHYFSLTMKVGLLPVGTLRNRLAQLIDYRSAIRHLRQNWIHLREKKKQQKIKELKRKYDLSRDKVIEIKNRFMNCTEGSPIMNIQIHSKYDLALLKFSGFTKLLCETFPVFAKIGSNLKQGTVFSCRLAFPFPESKILNMTKLLIASDGLSTGRRFTPRFPIEGMVTRHLLDPSGALYGFELSTPVSGDKAADQPSTLMVGFGGMQSKTAHLDLNFDVDVDVVRGGSKRRVRDSAFLHVGHCIHVDVLKQFMRDHGCLFLEG